MGMHVSCALFEPQLWFWDEDEVASAVCEIEKTGQSDLHSQTMGETAQLGNCSIPNTVSFSICHYLPFVPILYNYPVVFCTCSPKYNCGMIVVLAVPPLPLNFFGRSTVKCLVMEKVKHIVL